MVQIDPTALKGFVAALLESAGSAPGEAEVVSDHLVEANLKGHDSHGVGMLNIYTDQVSARGRRDALGADHRGGAARHGDACLPRPSPFAPPPPPHPARHLGPAAHRGRRSC